MVHSKSIMSYLLTGDFDPLSPLPLPFGDFDFRLFDVALFGNFELLGPFELFGPLLDLLDLQLAHTSRSGHLSPEYDRTLRGQYVSQLSSMSFSVITFRPFGPFDEPFDPDEIVGQSKLKVTGS